MPLVTSSESRLITHRAVSGGWWLSGGISAANCIAAYAPKGAASQAASYTNLANPGTYNAAPGTAPTWNATDGWVFLNANSQYLNTGIFPSVGYSAIIRYSNAVAGVGTFRGLLACRAATAWEIGLGNNSGQLYTFLGDTAPGWVTTPAGGVVALAGKDVFFDGSNLGTITTNAAAPNLALCIGARNGTVAPAGYLTAYIQSIAIYSTTLTLAMVQAVTTSMNAL